MAQSDEIEDLKAYIRDLEGLLKQTPRDLELAAKAFGLPQSQARLFGLLRTMPVVTSEVAEVRARVATDVKVAIYRLRDRLRAHGIIIQSQYGIGYWLTAEDKIRISRIISESERGDSPDTEEEIDGPRPTE